MHENKDEIVRRLWITLKATRAGEEIKTMKLLPEQETVRIEYIHGAIKEINVACDSGIALIKVVADALAY